jgi:hypothetical protein
MNTFFFLEVAIVGENSKERSMDHSANFVVVGEGRVHPIEEGVEPVQSDGIHALGARRGVVLVQLPQEDLRDFMLTARLLSFSSSISPLEKALSKAKATVS